MDARTFLGMDPVGDNLYWQEILTVNAALGDDQLDLNGVWVERPNVPPPDECPPRFVPEMFRNTILDKIEVRVAKGMLLEDLSGEPGRPDSALWAHVPGHLTPSAATLAIFGDYVSGGASQPLGRRSMGRSLDNTLRVAQLRPTEWVLCDIRIHAIVRSSDRQGIRPGCGLPLVRGRRAVGHRKPVLRRSAVAGAGRASRVRGTSGVV
jgi:acyl-CoA thioesterase